MPRFPNLLDEVGPTQNLLKLSQPVAPSTAGLTCASIMSDFWVYPPGLYGTAQAQQAEQAVLAHSSRIGYSNYPGAALPEKGESHGQITLQEAPNESLWDYEQLFKLIFDDILLRRIRKASEKLLEGSRRLVNSVQALGMFD